MRGFGMGQGGRYDGGYQRRRPGPRRGGRPRPQNRYDARFGPGVYGPYGVRSGYGYSAYGYPPPDPGGWSHDGGYGEDFAPYPSPSSRQSHGAWGNDGWPGRTSDVDAVRAADIMTHNPEAATPETPVADVARRMRDLDVGVMPVVDDVDSYRLRGIVTDRDIAVRLAAEGKDAKKTRVDEIMSTGPQTVGENDHVREVFTVMKRARVRRVPVVDADGRLVGIVAQADLAVNYAGLDLQRETEVEEVIERISEPARPRWGREDVRDESRTRMLRRFRPRIDVDLPDRVRAGWRTLRREARDLMSRDYDEGWR